MKKIGIFLFILVLAFSVSASAIESLATDLYSNSYSFVIPLADISVHHLSQIMKSPAGASSLSKLMHGKATLEEGLDSLVLMFRDLNTGYDKIADASAGFGFAIGNKAFAYDVSCKVDTFAEKSASLENLSLCPAVISSFSFAYGFKPIEFDLLKIDITAIGHINTLAENDSITYKTIVGEDEVYFKGNVGMGFPLDLKMNFRFRNCGFEADVNADNLAAFYFTKRYSSAWELEKSVFSFGKNIIYKPVNLNVSLRYTFDFRYLDIILFTEMDSINSLFTEPGQDFLKRKANYGVKFNVNDIVELETGIYNGYFGASAFVGYNNNKIGFRYDWRDMGTYYGKNPTDCLTVMFSLGWKK